MLQSATLFSAEHQPSPEARRAGQRRAVALRAFRSDFFWDIIIRKDKKGIKNKEKIKKLFEKSMVGTPKEFAEVERQARWVLEVIDKLTPKDFDYEVFTQKMQIYLGGKLYPQEHIIAEATES